MITDEIIEAIDLLGDICSNKEQANGISSVREMLCDFAEGEWMDMGEDERKDWLEQFLSCKRKK